MSCLRHSARQRRAGRGARRPSSSLTRLTSTRSCLSRLNGLARRFRSGGYPDRLLTPVGKNLRQLLALTSYNGNTAAQASRRSVLPRMASQAVKVLRRNVDDALLHRACIRLVFSYRKRLLSRKGLDIQYVMAFFQVPWRGPDTRRMP